MKLMKNDELQVLRKELESEKQIINKLIENDRKYQ